MKFKSAESKSVSILGKECTAGKDDLIEIPDDVILEFNRAGRHEEFAALGVERVYELNYE